MIVKGVSDVLDYGENKTRASLAQTFSATCGHHHSRCPSFTVVVNHFKSKGSDCDDIGDPDADDGQVRLRFEGRCRGCKIESRIIK